MMIRPECEQHYTPSRDNQYRATARYYKDSCPYCEIDRLKADLEEANNTIVAHANTISRVEAANVHLQDQLASANKHKSDWHNMYQETYDELSSVQQAILVETARIKTAWREIATLEQQLSEAKESEAVDAARIHLFDEEVEDLRKQLSEAKAEVERLKVIKWVQTESYEAVAAVEQARQEAARECRDAVYKLYTDWQKGNNYYTAEYAEAISDALRVIDKLEG